MELHQSGFTVRRSGGELQGALMVDLGHFRRIFDNLFSNVHKYADTAQSVEINQRMEGRSMAVTITNHIRKSQTRPESNRIGLQTCQKLVSAMGGEFRQSKTKDTFTVEVVLPLRME